MLYRPLPPWLKDEQGPGSPFNQGFEASQQRLGSLPLEFAPPRLPPWAAEARGMRAHGADVEQQRQELHEQQQTEAPGSAETAVSPSHQVGFRFAVRCIAWLLPPSFLVLALSGADSTPSRLLFMCQLTR